MLADCSKACAGKLGRPFCFLVDEAQNMFDFKFTLNETDKTTLLTPLLQVLSENSVVYLAGTSLDFKALEHVASAVARGENRYRIFIWRKFAYHSPSAVKAHLTSFLKLPGPAWEPIFEQLAGRSRLWGSVLRAYFATPQKLPDIALHLATAVKDIERDLEKLSQEERVRYYLAMLLHIDNGHSTLPILQKHGGVFFNNYVHGSWLPLTIEDIKHEVYRPGEALGQVHSRVLIRPHSR